MRASASGLLVGSLMLFGVACGEDASLRRASQLAGDLQFRLTADGREVPLPALRFRTSQGAKVATMLLDERVDIRGGLRVEVARPTERINETSDVGLPQVSGGSLKSRTLGQFDTADCKVGFILREPSAGAQYLEAHVACG
jgi:hypothetical protein